MKIKNSLKELSAVGLPDIIGTSASAFFWFYLASVIDPEQYGEIFFYIGIASIASSVVLLANQNTITVYVAKKIQLQSTLYWISLIGAFIASTVLILWFYRLDVGFVLIGYVINTIAIGYLLGKKFFISYSKFAILQKSLVLILGLSFFYIFGVDGILYAIALSYTAYVIIVAKGLKSDKINLPLLKSRLGFVTNNYSFGIIQKIKGHIDVVVIPLFLSFTILGNYALALQIMSLLNMLPAIVYKFILPNDSTGNDTTSLKILTLIASGCLAVLGITLSPFLIPYLFPEFIETIIAIQIMSLAAIPNACVYILTSKFLAMEKSRYVLISRLIALTILSIGMIILGTYFGLLGLGIAYLLANILEFCFLMISNLHENKKIHRNS